MPYPTAVSSQVGISLWSLLLLSAALTILESIDYGESPPRTVFLVARCFFSGIFTLEAVLDVLCRLPSQALRSPIVWLDWLTVLPFWIRLAIRAESFSADSYLGRDPGDDTQFAIKLLESLALLRLLKLARYYEGAQLLARAMAKSATQLLVPMFMLFIMVVCFSTVLVALEWSGETEQCIRWWLTQRSAEGGGIDPAFIKAHPAGVTWDCSVCEPHTNATGGTAGVLQQQQQQQQQLCFTCLGFPDEHPECLNVRWSQRFPNVPTAMWFML